MACVLCHGQSLRRAFAPPGVGSRALERCTACKLMQMNPMPTDAELSDYYQKYDVLGEREPYYAALWGPDALATDEGKDIRSRFDWMRTHTPQLGKVLDVGSGPGLFLRLIKENGGKAFGVELNARAAERSAREVHVPVHAGTISDITETNFGAITLWDLLEHVNDPVKLIRRCSYLTGSGGWLFIETPNESSLLDFAVRTLATLGLRGPANTFYGMHHLVLLRPRTIRRLLEENGFKVVEIRGVETTVGRIFRGTGIKDKVVRLGLGALFVFAQIVKRQNKMLIAAQKV